MGSQQPIGQIVPVQKKVRLSPLPKQDISRLKIGGPVLFGLVVMLAFFGGFLGWAAFAPLSSAAIAPGSVVVETNRKTVQHLEGGIVGRIHVREGDVVQAGQVLIELDDTKGAARISLLRGQIEAGRRQIALLREEIGAVTKLLDQGLAQKPRLLALQRREAEVDGNLKRLEAQLVDAADVLKRLQIRAGIDGRIVGLRVHTTGGVITAGMPLMDIVPSQDRLVVEARVRPIDIDVVTPGLNAMVYLTPFNRRNLKPIEAKVVSVSADQFTEQRTGTGYYRARVELLSNPAEVFGQGELYPGMPAEIMIVTGERTVLESLIQPIAVSLNRALREG